MSHKTSNKKQVKMDPESGFFIEIAARHAEWKGRAAQKTARGHNASREEEYAEAYRVLLNRFSSIEESSFSNQ